MNRREVIVIAKELFGNKAIRRELADILVQALGDPLEPRHPIVDLVEDHLTEVLDYANDDAMLWNDKIVLTEVIVGLMARAIKNG